MRGGRATREEEGTGVEKRGRDYKGGVEREEERGDLWLGR